MGYYTRYELEVKEGNVKIEDILEQVENKFDGLYYAVDEWGKTLQETKWYEHDEEMKELSKLFPDVVFKLKGEGEESGDVWINYYKNGKMQSCPAKITFDEFDEIKLK
jgi:hypothetical protein